MHPQNAGSLVPTLVTREGIVLIKITIIIGRTIIIIIVTTTIIIIMPTDQV